MSGRPGAINDHLWRHGTDEHVDTARTSARAEARGSVPLIVRRHGAHGLGTETLRRVCSALAVALASLAAGCATGGASTDGSSSSHTLSAYGDDPIAGDGAVLWLKGMSCPLCATNVDKQLKRVEGVKSAAIDLGNGTVTLRLEGSTRPSPRRLAEAVRESGFTLEKIEAN